MQKALSKDFIPGDQRGFTLIEILIALLIGVFLLGALLTIVQTNRAVFGNQSQLAQLQDSERMAMTMMADVIQSAGYFTDPLHNTQTSAFPAAGVFAQDQAIYGTSSGTPQGDIISVRYMTGSGDGILNCSGLPNTSGANAMYVNTLQVNSNGQLICTMNTVQYTLVNGVTNSSSSLGVTNLSILYGVKNSASFPDNNVDTYVSAALMTPANWASVMSVMVKLTFTNPLYTGPGLLQPATITFQRVINVMNQVGPTQ